MASPSPTAPIALLFPGQGSQTSGMAAVTAAQRPDLLEQAREELGADPFEAIADGTHTAQPALYCAGLAHYKQAGEPDAEMFCGHSLGELAALAAGGALEDADGLRLAVARGRLMEEASAVRPGGMVASLGGSDELVAEIAAGFELTIANDNAPGQVILSGDAERVGEARKAIRAGGAKAIRLPVAGAFHSPLMEPAVEGYREALAATEFAAPVATVYSSIRVAPFEDVRADLLAALTEPVRWRPVLSRMFADGARVFLETGPGDILTGLVDRTLDGRDFEARSLASEQEASRA